MTRVYVCRTDAHPTVGLAPYLHDYINKAKSGTLYRSRLSAYSLLFFALADFLDRSAESGVAPDPSQSEKTTPSEKRISLSDIGDCPELKWGACADFSELRLSFDERGKPYLLRDGERFPLEISLSHTDALCAAILSDEGAVGVDLEGEIENERAERLAERFFSSGIAVEKRGSLRSLYTLFEGAVSVFEPSEAGYSQNPRDAQEKDSISFTERWVICEAMLKCEGGGFGSLTRLSELAGSMSVYSAELNLGEKRHFIAAAEWKRDK